MQNSFFDRESYENDIDLETNEDVLKRIYDDGVNSNDKLPIEFFFLTDSETKAVTFRNRLELSFPEYREIEILDYKGDFEISGQTNPIQISLQSINEWNKAMWDFGYEFDCKLDGWQVGVTH